MLEISKEIVELDNDIDHDKIKEYLELIESGEMTKISSLAKSQFMKYVDLQNDESEKVDVVVFDEWIDGLQDVLSDFESFFYENDTMVKDLEQFLMQKLKAFETKYKDVLQKFIDAKITYDLNREGFDINGNSLSLADRLKMLYVILPKNMPIVAKGKGISINDMQNILVNLIEHLTEMKYEYDEPAWYESIKPEGTSLFEATNSDLDIEETIEKINKEAK